MIRFKILFKELRKKLSGLIDLVLELGLEEIRFIYLLTEEDLVISNQYR